MTREQKKDKIVPKDIGRDEVFAKLNANAERTLWALEQAYEAGMKEGISDEELDQLTELLSRAKELCDEVRHITSSENIENIKKEQV